VKTLTLLGHAFLYCINRAPATLRCCKVKLPEMGVNARARAESASGESRIAVTPDDGSGI
jgi:hypothetical protein